VTSRLTDILRLLDKTHLELVTISFHNILIKSIRICNKPIKGSFAFLKDFVIPCKPNNLHGDRISIPNLEI
jgi:hypothetical protein